METMLHWVRNQLVDVAPKQKRFRISVVVAQIFELFAPTAGMKNITLISCLQDSLFVNADEEMIRIVLKNLISNAIKFSRENESVIIFSEPGAQENYLKISIKDSGRGMSAETVSGFFGDQITRIGSTEKRPVAGLSLTLCREYVRMNGGKMGVESEEEQGSCFWFTLPV
jgi:signal transduction histidine kinase